MAIGLKGILSFSEEPQAILIVNNKQVMVKTGGLVADHFTVIRIDHESIVLKDTSGLEKVLMVGEFL